MCDHRTNGKAGIFPVRAIFFVPDLCENLDKFDRNKPVVAYCDSGYRASLASSILKRQGFKTVYNVPGSWQAWTHAGYPIEGKMN